MRTNAETAHAIDRPGRVMNASNLKDSGTVTEPLGSNVHTLQQRQEQVCQRRVRWDADVASTLEGAIAATDYRDGQIIVRVPVAVGEATAVQDQRPVQQRAVAVPRAGELCQEVGKQHHVMRIDAREPLQGRGLVAVVREQMVRFGYAD